MKNYKQIPLMEFKKYKLRKQARPIATRSPNHIVLKARLPILRRNHLIIRKIIQETQRRFGIRIRSISILETHIHLLVESANRILFQNALRFLTGQIALKIAKGPLWLNRAWSRVVKWGRDFLGVRKYIEGNPVKAEVFDETDVFVIKCGILLDSS